MFFYCLSFRSNAHMLNGTVHSFSCVSKKSVETSFLYPIYYRSLDKDVNRGSKPNIAGNLLKKLI